MNKNIIFFDGVCNLCNGLVNIIIKLDREKKFYFASLQGETAKQLQFTDFSSVIYMNQEGAIFDKSDAVIEIMAKIFIFGKIILIIKIFPKVLRDLPYRFISKYRYQIFGKKNSCQLPTSEEKNRFLA